MNRVFRSDEVRRLRELGKKLEESKVIQEKESRKAKFPGLMQFAVASMNSNRSRTWNNKQGSLDADKKAELDKKVSEDRLAFDNAYRQIVRNDLRNWWGAEVQKAYIQGMPEALLIYYLSDDPARTQKLSYALKKAADDYIRGWELLGKKNRKELSGPIDAADNGLLAVQMLIEQLKKGDGIQQTQAKILEIVFESPISALGRKTSEPNGFESAS